MKKVLRTDFEGRETLIWYEHMKEDLLFQIKQDEDTYVLYKEYLEEHVDKQISFDEYCDEVFKFKLEDLNNGYSVSALGDTYYFNE